MAAEKIELFHDWPSSDVVNSFFTRRNVAGNAYETDPAYVLSSFKWCAL